MSTKIQMNKAQAFKSVESIPQKADKLPVEDYGNNGKKFTNNANYSHLRALPNEDVLAFLQDKEKPSCIKFEELVKDKNTLDRLMMKQVFLQENALFNPKIYFSGQMEPPAADLLNQVIDEMFEGVEENEKDPKEEKENIQQSPSGKIPSNSPTNLKSNCTNTLNNHTSTSISNNTTNPSNNPNNGFSESGKQGLKKMGSTNFSKKGKIEEDSSFLKSVDLSKSGVLGPCINNYSFGVVNSNIFNDQASGINFTLSSINGNITRSSSSQQSNGNISSNKNSNKHSSNGKIKSQHKHSNSNAVTLGDEIQNGLSQNYINGYCGSMSNLKQAGKKVEPARQNLLKTAKTFEVASNISELDMGKSCNIWPSTTGKKRTKSQNFHSDFKTNVNSIKKNNQKTPDSCQRLLTEALDFSSALDFNSPGKMAPFSKGGLTANSLKAGSSMLSNTASTTNLFAKKNKPGYQHDMVTKTQEEEDYNPPYDKEPQSDEHEQSWEFNEYPNRNDKSKKIKAYQRSIREAFSSERAGVKARENSETPSKSSDGQWIHSYLKGVGTENDKSCKMMQSFDLNAGPSKYEYLIGGFMKSVNNTNYSTASHAGTRGATQRMDEPPLINCVLSFEKEKREFFLSTEGNNNCSNILLTAPLNASTSFIGSSNLSNIKANACSSSSKKRGHHVTHSSINYNSTGFGYGSKQIKRNEGFMGMGDQLGYSLRSPVKHNTCMSSIRLKTSPISSSNSKKLRDDTTRGLFETNRNNFIGDEIDTKTVRKMKATSSSPSRRGNKSQSSRDDFASIRNSSSKNRHVQEKLTAQFLQGTFQSPLIPGINTNVLNTGASSRYHSQEKSAGFNKKTPLSNCVKKLNVDLYLERNNSPALRNVQKMPPKMGDTFSSSRMNHNK